MKWAGHMVRTKDDKLPKRAETKKREGCRKRGKTTAKMGGLCEEKPEKGRGGRKVERKGQQQGPMEANYESSRIAEWRVDRPHPYTRETRERTSLCAKLSHLM